jgi:hypothetical protein
MPPLPSVPNVIKCVISTELSGAPVENIFHISYSGAAPSSGTLGTWLTSDFLPPTETFYNAEGSTSLTGVSVELTDLSSDLGAVATEALTVTGVRTGDFAPASAAVCISWTINRRYRGGHPRTYFPFGTAGTYEAGSSKLWDTSFLSDVLTKSEAWTAGWYGTTTAGTTFEQLVNVSYIDKNLNPTPPYRRTTPVVDAIVAQVVKQRICSQRRRLGKIDG